MRGAFGHLFHVMKERAGEHFDRLMEDHRVGEFIRKVSIAACDKIAGWAQAAADHLRRRSRGDGPDTLAADALQNVTRTSTAYGSAGSGSREERPVLNDLLVVGFELGIQTEVHIGDRPLEQWRALGYGRRETAVCF
ncbi:hypothetical protein [Streptomyces sp. NPDC046859]|uniref:hypothetical protein n=1 Tax=Streptomyces sp. NPDC046859 TaxID=3155734 RepID=UPI0033EBE4BC